MLIDIHGHCLKTHDLAWGGEPFVWPEKLLEMHAAAGIDKGVLLPIVGPDNAYMIQSNEEVLQITAEHPGHFIPFCNLDPRMMYNSTHSNFSYLMEYYKEKGCKGIGEMTANLSFTDPRCLNFFSHAEKCGMPITFHIAIRDGEIYGVIDDLGLPRLEYVLQHFPNLKFLAHSQSFWANISADITRDAWGGYPKGPVTPGRVVELMRKYPNLLGDLSAGSGCNALTRDPNFAYEFLDEFQDKLFFGTDICQPSNVTSVMVMLRDFLNESLAGKHISQSVYDKVTHLNAIKLFEL